MSNLSLEIWRRIFTLACTDGGRIGASLSQVSRRFNYASLPARFHSISLANLSQIESFLVLFQKHSHKNAKVRHLLLSFLSHSDVPAKQTHNTHPWQTPHCAISKLLETVAPNLWTLTWIHTNDIMLPDYDVVVRFPVLEELTIMGDCVFFPFSPSPCLDRPTSIPTYDQRRRSTAPTSPDMGAIDIRFPSLMRLHIVEDDPEYYEIAWQECANAAPSVTHLRMSNLNSELLSRDTFGVVAGVNSEAYCQGQSGRLRIPIESYASLRYIIVQPMDSGMINTRALRRACRQLNTASQKARIVRRRGRHMGESWVWRLKKEWEDRMCGGVGCWIETETEEIEWQRRLALEEAINGPLKAYANHKADV